MAATGPAIMEVDPGSVAGTAVDRFLDEPLARGLNGETAVDRFLDEPLDRGPAGETAVLLQPWRTAAMSIVRIPPEGRRNSEHIAIIIVVDLVPSKAIFAQDGHRLSIHCIKTPTRPQAQLKTATG